MGYVQYRFGIPGKLELQYPASRTGTQSKFTYDEMHPHLGLSRTLTFTRDGYKYSVYSLETDQPGGANSYGVWVFRAGSTEQQPLRDLRCARQPEGSTVGLQGVLKESQ